MKVLVTGGCGFIGSHISDLLIANNHSIAVADNLSTGKLENLNDGALFYEVDILGDGLAALFEEFKPDAVCHEAAQISVPKSIDSPAFDADANIMGTINVLECCKRHGAKLIFASSAAVYGTPEYLGIDEAHPTRPMSPYGLSKLTAENYIRLYRELYGLRYTILRYANVYGPRQDAKGEGGVVSIFTDRAKHGLPLVIYGNGEQSRDFIHAHDVAAANLAALTKGGGETVNIGTGRAITVNELCSMVSKLPPQHEAERAGDIPHSYFNNEKMKNTFGFTPSHDLQAAIVDLLK